MIPATLSLTDATRPLWDVLVVGAGPAGAIAARELARRGRGVLLLDRAEFPRWKVCGCCVNLRAQGHQALIATPGERVLSRMAFDAALVESAIAEHAHFLPRAEARFDSVSTESCAVNIRRDGHDTLVRCKVVVAADGLCGGFLRSTDLRSHPAATARIGAGAIGSPFPSFLLGDAAGYIEPFTGEGIAWALAGGIGVVPLADRACERWRPGLVREWTECHRRIVTQRQWLCRTVAGVLRRPWLARGAVMILRRAPGLAGAVLRYVNGG